MIVACCPWCGAEYCVTDTRCWDCKLSLVDRPEPTLAEGADDDDVGFELEEWSAGERGRLSAGLRERAIAFRWEPGLTLVVGVPDEDLVDSLLDAMESSDRVGRLRGDDDDFDDDFNDGDEDDDDEDDEAGGDGGERAHAAMGDLFVAADRLIQRPDDGRIAEQLVAATLIVQESRRALRVRAGGVAADPGAGLGRPGGGRVRRRRRVGLPRGPHPPRRIAAVHLEVRHPGSEGPTDSQAPKAPVRLSEQETAAPKKRRSL